MADKPMSYKGYLGSIEASVEDACLHGKLLFIDDLITYEGDTVPALVDAFRAAVDDYLAYCEETGKQANKTFSGSFNWYPDLSVFPAQIRIAEKANKRRQRCRRQGLEMCRVRGSL